MAKQMTMGVIVGNRGFFPSHLATSGRLEMIAALEAAGIKPIVLTPEDAGSAPVIAHLSHAHATNRLLQDAVIQLPHAGRWHAVLHIREAGREASASTDLTVANYSARRGTVWFFAILPICVVALFAWVQVAKQRARRRRMLSPA